MIRNYPIEKPVSAPSTGSLLYEYLLRNIPISARASHNIWFEGEKAKLGHPEKYSFRGVIPINRTLELLTLAEEKIIESDFAKRTEKGTFIYTLNGKEKAVLVCDLSDNTRKELGIPENARPRDKVFNPNFVEYDKLNEFTKYSNELVSLSVPKSISNHFGSAGNLTYSEVDVLKFLTNCIEDLNSKEMMQVLHGAHLAWAALDYIRGKGTVGGDIMTEFHAHQPTDFYMKDVGTVLPCMFFALASLGQDPVVYHNKLDTEIWGAKDVAVYMQQFMPKRVAK